MEGRDAFARSQLFGASLRLAFHDAGEIDLPLVDDRLGPDGCLSSAGYNSGLIEADEEVNSIIEVSWQQFCTRISRADFWALWGKLTAELASGQQVALDYFYGRVDNRRCDEGKGRLPRALLGMAHIKAIFVGQMGLTMHDAVALMGAHSVGHMYPRHSDFGLEPGDPRDDGTIQANAWDTTPDILDNRYYTELLCTPWYLTPASTYHSQEYTAEEGGTLRLNTDMSLAFENIPNEVVCGGNAPPCVRVGSTSDQIASYVADNQVFLNDFSKSYTKMVNVGYGYSDPHSGEVFLGKLGHLEFLDC